MRKLLLASGRWLIALILFLIFSYLPLAISYQSTAFAQEALVSAEFKAKLKALQEDIASRAANMKIEVARKLQNKAYIGIIKEKDSTSLILSVKENNRNININKFTEYIIKSKTYTGDDGLNKLATENTIAALGDIDDNGVLTAKRIVKLSAPMSPPKKIIYGTVTSLSNGKVILKTTQGDQYSISFDKKTDYQMGKSDGSLDNIKVNTWLIVVAEPGAGSDLFQAKFVYIFPYTLRVKPKPSTPSAKPISF